MIAQVNPITAQLAILSEEKKKAKEYQLQAKAALDNLPKLYDEGRDYSFLKLCMVRYKTITLI